MTQPSSASQPRRRPIGVKAWLWPPAVNMLLTVISTIVAYFLIELIFFRIVLPNIELNVRPHLTGTAGVLVQHSKTSWVPQNYIAILGDSYAEGIGDWLISNGGNESLPFGATDVLHELTRRDVVSFGRGGSSNAEAFVRQPAHILGGSRCLIFPTLDPPAQIFAFFYEGNDVQDNLRFATAVAARYGRVDASTIDRYLTEQYAAIRFWHCHLSLGDSISRMARFWYQYRNFRPEDLHPRAPGGNMLLVSGKRVEAPAPMEGPALEIDERGFQIAFSVLERSLLWMRRYFSMIPITLTYIPSPLATYTNAGDKIIYMIEPESAQLVGSATPVEADRNSRLLCSRVQLLAMKSGLGFLNTRLMLRSVAADALIHGPVDWGHLNEKGYRTLAAALAGRLDHPEVVDACE
jgi:hypothetical protein